MRQRALDMTAEVLVSLAVMALAIWVGLRLSAPGVPATVLYVGLITLVTLRGRLIPALPLAIVGTIAYDAAFHQWQITVAQREWRAATLLVTWCASAVVITRLIKALRTSQMRWKAAFENNPTMYFMVDASATVLSVNPFGAEQLGYTPKELVGRPAWSVFLPEDRATARDHIDRCLAHLGQSMSWELRKVRKDGAVRWVRETARAVEVERGRPVVLLACEDITERKQTEWELRRSEMYLAEAQRLSKTGSFGWILTEQEPTHWSAETYRILGYDPGTPLTPERYIERIHPEDRPRVQESLDRLWQDGDGYTVRRRLLMPDGSTKYLDVMARALTNSAGVRELIGVIMDVTERERASEALRRSEAYLAEAQRLAHTGNWAFSPGTGRMVYWSDELYRIYGFDPQRGAPAPEDVIARIHPDDRRAMRTLIEQGVRGRLTTNVQMEHRIVLPDGTVRHVDGVSHPVFDDAGAVVEYVGTVVDLTERKRAEEAREGAEQALQRAQSDLARIGTRTTLGELAGSIAHELRQPLAAIAMNGSATLRWLNRDRPDLDEARDAATRTVREAQRADDVIRGLRALLGGSDLQRTSVDIADAVSQVLELVRGELRQHGIAVRTNLPAGLPAVFGDRVQLQQVVLNLILNGIEAMKSIDASTRELVLRADCAAPDCVAVAVEDSGPGLDPATAERIFDPFFTTKAHGLGMGLSICRSIVVAHGGELTASPRSPCGSTFRFTVPVEAPTQI